MLKLTQEQIRNLLVFLSRANLSGGEAEAMVQLKMLLNKELEKPIIPEQDGKKNENK